MSAHKRDIRRKCPCGLTASFEVFNTFNAAMGYYCAACSDKLIRKLDEAQREIKESREATHGDG